MNEENKNGSSGKVRIQYGNSVICVPGSVTSKIKSARKQDILLLLELLATPEATPEELAARCECDTAAVESGLAFWRGAGILLADDEDGAEASAPIVEEKTKKRPKELGTVPTYSSEEIAETIASDAAIDSMITDCQQTLGRMFGQTDSMRMVSVLKYFGLDPEYMLLVCAHCAGIGQKSVGYVVNTVSSLCEKKITTVEALSDYLFAIEKSASLETQIRKLFGMNMSRELTDREKGFISQWSDTFGYGYEIIKKAYEITVNTIGEPSLNYANAVLEKWYRSDLKTQEQIEDYLKTEKIKKKEGKKGDAGSFSSEDFFTAALARSYGSAENAPAVEKPKAGERRNFGVGTKK